MRHDDRRFLVNTALDARHRPSPSSSTGRRPPRSDRAQGETRDDGGVRDSALRVAVLALAWTFQRRLIYFPFGHVPSPSEVGLDGVEEVTFEHRRRDSAARVVRQQPRVSRRGSPSSCSTATPATGPIAPPGARVSRARAGRPVVRLPRVRRQRRDARPSLAWPRTRARHAHTWRTRADVDPSRVAYFGESLGAAVAVRLASESPPAALVLRSPFTSLAAVGRVHYPFLPVQLLLRDRWASLERIAQVTSPLAVIAGDRDSIVPPEQSRQVYDAAPGPKTLVIVRGADHNDADLVAGPEVIDATLRLLQ